MLAFHNKNLNIKPFLINNFKFFMILFFFFLHFTVLKRILHFGRMSRLSETQCQFWGISTVSNFLHLKKSKHVIHLILDLNKVVISSLLKIVLVHFVLHCWQKGLLLKFSNIFSFGFNSGCAINPARDFAPRLLSFIAFGHEKTFSVIPRFLTEKRHLK